MKRLEIILFLFPLLFTSCDKEDAWDIIKTSGPVVTEEREVSSFSEIEVTDRINIILVQDTVEKIILSGPKNLLAKVSTTNNYSTLKIRDNNNFNWVRSFDNEIVATVHVKSLKKIYYEGVGNITSNNKLVSDSLIIISQQSSGDINLSIAVDYFYCYFNQSLVYMNLRGTANRAHLQISGTGFLDCETLQTINCSTQNQGSGDIIANCSNYFSGIIEGSGNVLFTGNPNQTAFKYFGRGSGEFIEF
ncbi:MAG: head GIN domain-containing protein [Bacteroidales bacterium]